MRRHFVSARAVGLIVERCGALTVPPLLKRLRKILTAILRLVKDFRHTNRNVAPKNFREADIVIKFFENLRGVLSKDERFVDREGNLLRNKISEAATLFDENLLTLLLQDDTTKKFFFVDAADVTVFKQNLFIQVINGCEFLPGSFTRYANVIGLVDGNDNLIARTSDIALVFPYKDCLLEGG